MVDKIREVRRRSTRKELVGCVQYVVGKNIFRIKFEYGHLKDTSNDLVVVVSSKEKCYKGEKRLFQYNTT